MYSHAYRALFNPSGNPPRTLVVQCVQIKAMDSKGGDERYRVVFSDVNNFIQSMVATRKILLPSGSW